MTATTDEILDAALVQRCTVPDRLYGLDTDGNLTIDAAFVDYLCDRTAYDVLAALVVAGFACRPVTPGSAVDALPAAVARIGRIAAGQSLFSKDHSRIDDACYLFEWEIGRIPLDPNVRVLFAYELLLAGEVLSIKSYSSWLVTKFGPICVDLPQEQISEEFSQLKQCPAVTTQAEGCLWIDEPSFGVSIHIDFLAGLLKNGCLAVFSGAGISKASPSVAPVWIEFRNACFTGLLNRLLVEGLLSKDAVQSLLSELRELEMKPEVIMDTIYESIGDRLFDSLAVLASGSFNKNHDFLACSARAGFLKEILTTNFDSYIEKACEKEGTPFLALDRNDQFVHPTSQVPPGSKGSCVISKLHGSLSHRETIVMTLREAGKPLSKSKQRALARVISSYNVLFIGYSGYDDDIYPVLLKAHENSKGLIWCHRAYGRTAHVRRLLARHGTHAVSFEFNLDRLSVELSRRLGLEIKPGASPRGDWGSNSLDQVFERWISGMSTGEILEIVIGTLLHIGRKEHVVELAQRLLTWSTKTPEPRQKARALSWLADIAYDAGDLDSAEKLCDESLSCPDALSGLDDRLNRRRRLTQLKTGDIFLKRSRFSKAQAIYEEVLHTSTVAGDSSSAAQAQLCLGNLFLERLENVEALKWYRRASHNFRNLGEVLQAAICGRRIAGIFFKEGKYRYATRHMQKSLHISEELHDQRGIAAGHHNCALAQWRQNAFDNAESHFEEAAHLYWDMEDIVNYERTRLDLGQMYLRLGNRRQVLRIYGELGANFHTLRVTRPQLAADDDPDRSDRYTEFYRLIGDDLIREEKGFKPSYELSPRDRFADLKAQVALEANPIIERSFRIVEGREPANSQIDLADAHYNLAIELSSKGKPIEAADHARQWFELRNKLGFGSEYQRKQSKEWVQYLEEKNRDSEQRQRDPEPSSGSEYYEPSFAERCDDEVLQANFQSRPKRERSRRLVEGRERAKDLRDLADAFEERTFELRLERRYAEALTHARRYFQLNERLGFASEDARKRFAEWLQLIEKEAQGRLDRTVREAAAYHRQPVPVTYSFRRIIKRLFTRDRQKRETSD